jgi:N-formylglutamate amidohydrolase
MAGALPEIDLTRLFTLADNSTSTPVILHAPHGSRFIPEELKHSFSISSSELEVEKDHMTDHFTNDLVASMSGASSLVNGLCRFVVDVERFPDEREEMLAVGMGAFYTQGSQKQKIRDTAEISNPALREFFDAYSNAFTELVQRTVDTHGRAVIIDVHSYPKQPLPYELHSNENRPQLDIGADSAHTSALLVGEVVKAFSHLEVGINESFHGTYVPLRFYEAQDSRVQSVMLEIRRDTYMDESSVTVIAEGFSQLQRSLQTLITSLTVNRAR